jgi:hypothetical protein
VYYNNRTEKLLKLEPKKIQKSNENLRAEYRHIFNVWVSTISNSTNTIQYCGIKRYQYNSKYERHLLWNLRQKNHETINAYDEAEN